jgi:xylulokinase
MPYVKEPKDMLFTFGGAATAGALPKWFRDQFAELEKQQQTQTGINAYQVLEQTAKDIRPGSDGLIVLPYFMGERAPIWDVDARGTIMGLSLYHTKAHVYRAFLESVAFSLKHSMENIETTTHLGDKLILAGGVTKSTLWKQIFADVTDYPVVCPDMDVEANLGDVYLAGVGTGVMDYSDIKRQVILNKSVEPDPRRQKVYASYYQQYKSLYESLKGNMQEMALLQEELHHQKE